MRFYSWRAESLRGREHVPTIVALTPSKGNEMDVNFAHLELKIAQQGDLVLRDLGYFKTKILGNLDN